MGKNFKKFNPETQEWEVIASGNASGISSTNPRFLNGKSAVSVDEALTQLDNKISDLKSNIAWLAQYGGGGDGGGGDLTASIKLTNANIKPNEGLNIMYLSTKNVSLEYLITALKVNQKYLITVTLDGNTVINNQEGWSGTPGTLIIDNITKYSSNNTHSIVVTATDSEGMNVEPYLLTIIESSISISSSTNGVTATIGLEYKITYSITNKVLGTPTTLVVTNITNQISKSFDLGSFTTTDPLLFDVDFFSFFSGNPTTGSSYTIEAYAQTSIDSQIIESEKVTNRIVVEDGESLVVLVDGITTLEESESMEPTKFTSGGNISFTFTPYLANINIIYYAIRLQHSNLTTDVGIFDPSGAENDKFSDNQYTQRGTQKIFSYPIDTDSSYLGDWTITLRCWSEKGSPITDIKLKCTVVESSIQLLSDQNPQSSRFAWWNVKSSTFPQVPTSNLWRSTERNYVEPGELAPKEINCDLNIYNTNGTLSGFLQEKGQPKLRLTGESYGIIDYSPFTSSGDDNSNWSKFGFGISIAFKSDPHPFNNRTIFLLGDFFSDGNFSEGIRVTLEDVIWTYTDKDVKQTIACKIQQGVLNIVDFVVDVNNSEVKVFVNGILNAAREIKDKFTWRSNSKIYLACDYINGFASNFSDVEFYDIKLFRRSLNDKQIVINTLNTKARSNCLPDGTFDFSLYNTWKSKNFFSTSTSTATTMLWNDQNNTYANITFEQLISDSNRKPPLPVVYIDCNGSGFTKDVYEAIGANPIIYPGCTFNYYDPNSAKASAVTTNEMSVQIQGTSSTGYRSKNLEIIFNKVLQDEEGQLIGPELFQPKDTWMPENQFTLKADIVDSAHANNASIGKWINDNADILFENTPPMDQLESRRPVDTYDPSITHKKVTIKHTLEGFPVILIVKFDKTDVQEMLGIYSFNLGRNAYYNMGFKFFKSFSLKIKDSFGAIQDNQVPAFVTSYETYKNTELFGDINPNQIYSYEFSENANLINTAEGMQPTALFWQDDLSILKHVGEFRYNGANGDASEVSNDEIWKRLQLLFTDLASMTGEEVKKYIYDEQTRGYKLGIGSYPAQQSWSSLADDLTNRLSIRNAYSYFIICIAFGLVDSLGKNMTLRSWNVGGELTSTNHNKWYPCFYDMDTANGLSNTGEENVPKTAYIDTFDNAKVESGVNSLVITRNSPNGGYDTYSSRLWDVLRDSRFINTGVYSGNEYNGLWDAWRNRDSLLKNSEYFLNTYFSTQTKDCGELLYNFDYKVKYLTKYSNREGAAASYANIEFLHGTRQEFVRDWLKKRFLFLDGVFYYNNNSNIFPYNEKGAFKCGGAESSNPKLIVTSNCPLIFTVNIGQTSAGDVRYMVLENTPTEITLAPISSFNTQITINGISQISELGGLKDIRFQGFMTTLNLPSFSELDLSGVNTLSSNPILFENAFINRSDYSDVRNINLSNTSFWEVNQGVSTFTVNISKYTKLKKINISNSCVTSLSLPNASLSELNITNSTIEKITLSSQPFLSSIDFFGCNKLTNVVIENCSKLKSLNLSNLQDLQEISITGCIELEELIIANNPKLESFSISGCPKVLKIDLSGNTNKELNIYIPGASNLQELNLSKTNTNKTIQLADNLTTIKVLNISNSGVNSFQFGNNPVPKYNNSPILDLSNFELQSLTVSGGSFINIKFNNSKTKPFSVGNNFFRSCKSLKRVFGHIKLTGTSTFYDCSNYYIHELPDSEIIPIPTQSWFGADCDTSQGKEEWNNNTNLDSNISIETTSLADTFYKSGVNLYDVYYILSKCDNVTDLRYTFSTCNNIHCTQKNSFDRNMFAHCTKVTTIRAMFYDSSNISTILRSPTRDSQGKVISNNGLFSPLRYKCNTIDAAFWNVNVMFDSYLFNTTDEDYKLTSISFINGTSIDDSNLEYNTDEEIQEHRHSIDVGVFFKNLSNLIDINYLFYSSNTSLLFNTDTYEKNDEVVTYCNALYNTPNVKTIYYSFNSPSSGNLINLFGGHKIFDGDIKHFPQKLSTIRYAFNGGSNLTLPINNSFFRKISSTIEYITGEDIADVRQSTVSFNVNKIYQKESEEEEFCYDIFKQCTKLKQIPAFFNRLQCSTPINISIPGDMFVDCTQLQNIDNLFANMGSNIKYTLTSRGFKNCKLSRARGCFSEDGLSFNKQGMIPYGLFYQESLKTKNLNGFSYSDALDLGITETFGVTPEGEWISDDDLQTPQERTYTIRYTALNKTIRDLSNVFSSSKGDKILPYTCNYGDLTNKSYGDILCVNEAYNPVKYILNPNYDPRETIPNPDISGETIPNPNRNIYRIIQNPQYNPYKLSWNIYAVDGNSSLESIILNSELYKNIQNETFTDVPKEFPEGMFDPNDFKTNPNTSEQNTNKGISNYICSPDLYLYCINSSDTSVTQGFFGCGREPDSGFDYRNFGIRGRIPPMLFKPVNKITSLSGIFYTCKLINPYYWNHNSELGMFFSEELFKGLTALKNLSYAFAYLEIPSNVVLSSKTFSTNIQLTNLEKAFMGAEWNDTVNQQLPEDIFSRNNSIQNLNSCFASYTVTNNVINDVRQGRSPKIISSNLFTKNLHKNINDVTLLFGNATRTKGSVPEFWTWLEKLNVSNRSNVFLGISKSNITNSSSIPSNWSTGMV